MPVDSTTSSDVHRKDIIGNHARMREHHQLGPDRRKTDFQQHTFHCRYNTEIQLRTDRRM